jgi:uncharacterized protein (DUF697 family)
MLNLDEADDRADDVINTMIATAIGMAVVPVVMTPAFIAGMGVGVVAIGRCYGVQLTRDEAHKLVKEFFAAAGFSTMAVLATGKLLAAVMAATGIGYAGGVVLDAGASAAIAYAVGGTAKSYFKGERNKKVLGRQMRERLRHADEARPRADEEVI